MEDEVARQVPEYGPTQREYARRMELAKQAEAKGGQFKLPNAPGVPAPSAPISPYMRMLYTVTRPLLKFGVGAAHQRTMASLADILTTQGPQDINKVLAELAARRPNAPVAPMPGAPYAGLLAAGSQQQ
jgi:hypothetical protein